MASMIVDTTSTASELAMEALLATLRGAKPEQVAEFRHLLHIDGAPVSLARTMVKGTGSVASSRVKLADIRSFPEWPLGDVEPTEEDYGLPESCWQLDRCVGRVIDSKADTRWSVACLRWGQCNKEVVLNGLCETCNKREACYMGKPGVWQGRVNEPVPSWSHTVGTDWFYEKKAAGKLFFNIGAAPPGCGAGSEPAASVASAASVESLAEARQKLALESQKKAEAAKLAKEAKELEKANAKLEKARLAAEAKAKKEQEALDAKNAKLAAAAALKAAKELEKAQAAEAKKKAAEDARALAAAAAAAKKAPVAKPPAAKPAAAPVAVPTAAKPPVPHPVAEEVKAEIELVEVDGEMYARKGDKLYMFDQEAEEVGSFMGILKGAGTEEEPYTIENGDEEESVSE